MPDRRLEKARRSLPTGYQFGDAASLKQAEPRLRDAVERGRYAIGAPIRFHSRVFAATIPPRPTDGWNTIEADEHGDEWAV